MSTAARLRLIAYSPNGAVLGPLPTPLSVAAQFPLSEVGALSLEYAKAGPLASVLGQPVEVALEWSADSGATWTEPPGARFLYLKDSDDPTKRPGILSADMPSVLWRLSKALVGTASLRPDGKRAFSGKTPGAILATLWDEAVARGGRLAGLTRASFSSFTDSAGVAWPVAVTIAYDPTLDLLSVLRNLVDQGLVDVRTYGRDVRLYVGEGTTTGADLTTGLDPVTLRYGQDLTESPTTRTWEGLASDVLLVGDGGLSLLRYNPSATQPWGRWEAAVAQGGVSDTGTMTVLSDAELERGEALRAERTNGLAFSTARFLPFTHYLPGQFVFRHLGPGYSPERLRLRSLTITQDAERRVGGNVVLADRFLEQDVRTARRVQGITGGALGGGSGTTAAPPTDTLAPAQTVGVVLGTSAYLNPLGESRAIVTVDWTSVVTNSDGTATADVTEYVVEFQQITSTGTWPGYHQTVTVPAATARPVSIPALVSGVATRVRVHAVKGGNGKHGAVSAEVQITTATDATPPLAPSTPGITQEFGQVTITWDGLQNNGTAQPIDYDRTEVHASTAAAFVPVKGGTTQVDELRETGRAQVGALGGYGVPVYVRLISVDRSGNASPPSVVVGGTPQRITGLDVDALAIATSNLADNAVTTAKIVDDAITAAELATNAVTAIKINALAVTTAKIDALAVTDAKIAALAVTTAKIADLAVDTAKINALAVSSAKIADLAVINAKIANLAVDDAKVANLNVGKLVTGTLVADMTLSARIKTANTGSRAEMSSLGFACYGPASNTVPTVLLEAATGNALITGTYISTRNTALPRIEMGPGDVNWNGGAQTLPTAEVRFYDPTTTRSGRLYTTATGFGDAIFLESQHYKSGQTVANSPFSRLRMELGVTALEVFDKAAPTRVAALTLDAETSAQGRAYFELTTSLGIIFPTSGGFTITPSVIKCDLGNQALGFDGTRARLQVVNEARVTDITGVTSFKPILASAFTVSSDRALKANLADEDLGGLAAVRAIKPKRWNWKADTRKGAARETVRGILVEDLPAALRRDMGSDEMGDVQGYSVNEVLALALQSIGQLADQVDALQARLAARS